MPGRRSRAAAEEEVVAAASSPAASLAAREPRSGPEATAKVTKPATGKGSGRRGRPRMDPALRKTKPYVPTGRPRGRPPKDPSQRKTPAAATPANPYTPTGRPRKNAPAPAGEAGDQKEKEAPASKKRGRISTAPAAEEAEEDGESTGSPASDLLDGGDIDVDATADEDDD